MDRRAAWVLAPPLQRDVRREILTRDLVVAAAIGIASRLTSLAMIAIAYAISPASTAAPGSRPFAVWDGWWYVSIAESGYHATPLVQGPNGPYFDFAFFPAWPALIAVLSGFGRLPAGLVAGVVANVIFVAACPVMYRAFRPFLDRNGAMWAIALVAFSPAAYVFSLAYGESLFVLIAAWAFAKPTVRIVGLAQIARLTGIAVGVGLATDAWFDRRGKRVIVGFLALPIVVFVAWAAVIAALTGRIDGYVLGSPSWYQSSGNSGGPATLFESPLGVPIAAYLALLVVGCFAAYRRARGAAVYALCVIGAAFLLGRWESMPRLALPAFPAVAGLVLMAERRWQLAVTLGLFVIAQLGLAILVAGPRVGP